MHRLTHCLTLALSLLALQVAPAFAQTTASTQAYPVKPIRIIVPYAPGGSTDVLFRIFAPRLTEVLGQQTLIDNRPGAASTIGLDLVAKSAPDSRPPTGQDVDSLP